MGINNGGGGASLINAGNWNGSTLYTAGQVVLDVSTGKAALCYQNLTAIGADTFDTSFTNNWAYTNGNLTAQRTLGAGGWQSTRSVHSFTTGKLYFECTLNQAHNTGTNSYDSWGIGFSNTSFVGTANGDFIGNDAGANSVGILCGNGNQDIWLGTSKHTAFAGTCFQPNDVIALAIDIGNARVWVRDITRDGGSTHWWGGNATGNDDPTNASTGFQVTNLVGSAVFIGFSGDSSSGATIETTINTTSVVGVVPSGYSVWGSAIAHPHPASDQAHWIGG